MSVGIDTSKKREGQERKKELDVTNEWNQDDWNYIQSAAVKRAIIKQQ
jgi:hypothetical protein